MKPSFILDCSMTMSWCFSDEATPESMKVQDQLVSESAIVPAHWFLEVSNVLAMAEKRKRITMADADQFLGQIATLDIQVDSYVASKHCFELISLCRTYGLTAYDAAYLDLAIRLQIPIASHDSALRKAVASLGMQVLG